MGDEVTFAVNDTNLEIAAVIDKLRGFISPMCDPHVKALVLTKLEEAQLWSLKLIREAAPHV